MAMGTAVQVPHPRNRSRTWIRTARRVLFYGGVVVVLVPPVFVFLWMFLSSLKHQVQNLAYPPLFVFRPTLDNYRAVFAEQNFARFMWNSLVIASGATGISLLLGLPAAHSIARFRQQKIAIGILIARMVPFVSYLLPWFLLFRRVGIVDTYAALITSHLIITLPMVIWLMVGFFEDVPEDLEESAQVDGGTAIQSFFRIALPVARNGVVTAAILSFIFSWNQFLFSLVLSGPRTKTVPVAVFNFISYEQINWGGLSAAATLITLPVLVLVLIIQRHIVRGLTGGAIKG